MPLTGHGGIAAYSAYSDMLDFLLFLLFHVILSKPGDESKVSGKRKALFFSKVGEFLVGSGCL
jgi:hypothetical protein